MNTQPVSFLREPFTPHPYEMIREGVLSLIVEEPTYKSWLRNFEKNQDKVIVDRLAYDSNGYNVTGLYLRPCSTKTGKHPLIIFNRGGRANYGMINILTINSLLMPLIEKDYLILASQYRGVDGGEGTDDFGGDEVNDILELAEIAKEIPEWDGKNIYMFGWSRGGMMSLLALKHGLKVNAVALGAPLIDLTISTEEGQKREAWLERVLPNYAEEGFAALEARSAPYWMNKLGNVPILLMHGDADKDVSIMHSRQLVQKLQQKGQPNKLVEYQGGNHYLNRQRPEVMQEVDAWFKKYRK